MLEIHLLGQFDVKVDGQPFELSSHPAQSLFAYLALNPARPQRREKLAGLLWPDDPEENGRRSLRQALWHIRRALGSQADAYIQADEFSIGFNARSAYWLDAAVLEPDGARSLPGPALAQAVAAYQGELLPGFYDDWVILERERLQLVYDRRMAQYLEQLVEARQWEQVLEWAEKWITRGQAAEDAFRYLMAAYWGLGDAAGVRSAFQRCRQVLQQELGVEPSDQTEQLYQQLSRSGPLSNLQKLLALEEPPAAGQAGPMAAEEQTPGPPPFKGLESFAEQDAGLYFGRQALVARLAGRLNDSPPAVPLLRDASAVPLRRDASTVPDEPPPGPWEGSLLVVVGASGSGKSSLVQAGLVPALRARQAAAGRPWQVLRLTPGAHPLEALAACFTPADGPAAAARLLDDLRSDRRCLRLFIGQQAHKPAQAETMLLVVDQFEELFSLCQQEEERRGFIEALLEAAQGGRLKLVLVLRADFYAACARYAALRQAIVRHQEFLGPLGVEELRQAITGPAGQGGWVFEPGLVDLILHDVGVGEGREAEPGALPLLSHALLETWNRRQGHTLTLSGYTEAGGVRGAIGRTAEGIYSQLTPLQQKLARAIFLRLTQLGEPAAEGGYGSLETRRQASLQELVDLDPGVPAVLEILAAGRLVILAQDTVEVAHEALIREWPTLRRWLAEDRDGLRLHRQLGGAAQEWQALDRDSSSLYRGARLAQALEWAAAHPGQLNVLEQAFLAAARQQVEEEHNEQEARRRRELEAAQKLAEVESRRAADQARSARRLRWLAAGLGVFLLAAALLAGLALQQRALALQQTRLATSRELAASAISNLGVDPERSILLALKAFDSADTPEAQDALHQAVQGLRLVRTLPLANKWGFRAVYSPDGRTIAATSGSASQPLQTELWDAASGQRLRSLPGALAATFWPDAGRLATVAPGEGDTTLFRFWNPANGDLLSSVTLAFSFRLVETGDLDPDWKRVTQNLSDGRTVVWDLATGQELFAIGQAGANQPSYGSAFSRDGKQLATTLGNVTYMYDSQTGRELFQLPSVDFGAETMAFSPDNSRVAVALGGLVKIADSATGRELLTLSGHNGFIYCLAFSPDGKRIAAGAADSTTLVWDAASGQTLMTLAGHADAVHGCQFSPDGAHLLTSSFDQTARIWDISPAGSREDQAWFDPGGQTFTGVAFSPDGARLAVSGGSTGGAVWDAASGQPLLRLPGQGSFQGAVAFSPDGRLLALTNGSELVDLLDAASGQKLRTLYGHSFWVGGLAFSPDGAHLLTISYDMTAVMWEVASGQKLFTVPAFATSVDTTQLLGVAFSPDGARFATTSAGAATIWDAGSGKKLLTLPDQGQVVYSLAFSPDSQRLALGISLGSGASVWDAATGRQLATLTGHHGSVQAILFSRDGRQILTGSVDGTVKLWDAASGQELLTLVRQSAQVNGMALSPDGARLAVASSDGTLRTYLLSVPALQQLARSRLTRPLSDEECQKYLHAACEP